MTDITDAGPRLKAMNDRLEELRSAADQADAEYHAEIERLKSRLRFCDAVIRSGDVAALTDKERTAIEGVIEDYEHDGEPASAGRVATLRGLLARLGDTPDTHATPTEGIEQDRCTLTDAEREAVEWFSHFGRPQNGPVIGKHAAALRGLLERMGGKR